MPCLRAARLQISTSRGKDDQDQDAILVAFADTGTGIPQNELVKIFDPFYTTKEIGKGTGLGLSLSYNIIKRFKGDITVAARSTGAPCSRSSFRSSRKSSEGDHHPCRKPASWSLMTKKIFARR